MQQKNPKCDATRIILTEDSRWLFTCGANSHFSLWSVDQKNKKITLTQTLERHKDTVIALLLVKNERYVTATIAVYIIQWMTPNLPSSFILYRLYSIIPYFSPLLLYIKPLT